MRSSSNKPGVREIAVTAGVSPATVSRVINGTANVHAEIQKKVRSSAESLGLRLSERVKTRAFAFLLSNRNMLHSFHSRVLVGAEACCGARGWDMLYLSFHYSSHVPTGDIRLPAVLQRRDVVRAVILAGTNSLHFLELLRTRGITFVVLGNNIVGDTPSQPKYDAVFSDDVRGGAEVTRYLISLGHRHIWFVGNARLPWFARCYAGYRSAMEHAGLAQRQSAIDSEDEADAGYLGAKSIVTAGEPLTAIFAGNDVTAQGVYRALRDCGLRVPDDVSVAGCDDTAGSMMNPPLTTIREFPEQLGRRMVELLIERLDNPGGRSWQVTIPTELVVRDSCRSTVGG